MALPTSRNTTYSALSKIKSADLNDVQDKIIALYAGWMPFTTRFIGASELVIDSGFTRASAYPYIELAATTSGLLWVPITVDAGQRIVSCGIVGASLNSVQSDLQASLRSVNAAPGAASPGTETVIVAAVSLPAAVATLQSIALPPTAPGHVAEVNKHYFLRVVGANSAGAKAVMHAFVSLDKV